MTIVSDSSPLITLARIDCLDLLSGLYRRIFISSEVYNEVVVAGQGLPGADQIEQASWIEVKAAIGAAALSPDIAKLKLGAGELSSILLAKELSADLVLIDERKARRCAQAEGLAVVGCVGILEDLYEQRKLTDLRLAYESLIAHKCRIDTRALQLSLARFNLPPL